ncbi:DUF4365 domain-containing protein [Micromonospora chalcea]|uniref:DUF4365 domain-containing protein n=1 Tax=Micromonospora chalcea TaxID=1874 RepID=UPI00165706CE|nr:DUF4365 domain-containing protein [Micromonospora chalcea]MBC8992200.1 DUF4365 domain-containing protein [Micromonospora chalcea]
MNDNVHQGLHGEGFIYALACASGLTTSKMNLDLDGVDWQVAHPGPKGTTRSPKIELQVKSKSQPDQRNGLFQCRLPVNNYNQLAGPGFQIPRFLAYVVVPAEAANYAVCSTDHMLLGTAAYWLSLADEDIKPTGDDDPKSVVVEVPVSNLLTVETLHALLAGNLEGATV